MDEGWLVVSGIVPVLRRLVEAAEARSELPYLRPGKPKEDEAWTAVVVEFVKATEEARKVLDGT